MSHDIHVAGLAFDLRPVEVGDAALIARLRSDPALNQHMPPLPDDVDAQRAWIERYLQRDDDWYFAVVDRSDGRAVGVIGIYDIDAGRTRAEWGRWVLEPGSLGAAESARHIYVVGFQRLGLHQMFCRSAVTNAQVLAFHDQSGLRRVGVLPGHLAMPDGPLDAVEHELDAADAAATIAFLDGKAASVARYLQRVAGR